MMVAKYNKYFVPKDQSSRTLFYLCVILSAFLCMAVTHAPAALSTKAINDGSPSAKQTVAQKALELQMPYTINQGQITNADVLFYANTFGGTSYVNRKGEIVHILSPSLKLDANSWTLRETLVGGSKVKPQAKDRASARVNYFIGNDQAQWKTNIPTFNEISLGQIYQGIDLHLKAYGKEVEKIFTVIPGADPAVIKIRISGADSLKVNNKGELEAKTGDRAARFSKPIAYQEIDGKRQFVPVAYRLSKNEYGFEIGNYDSTRQLIIDPTLNFSTYLGGSAEDSGNDIAIDRAGNTYVVGSMRSGSFDPEPVSTIFHGSGRNTDVFVAILNTDGSDLLNLIYLGGRSDDTGLGIAVEEDIGSSGTQTAIYITGQTRSKNFPTINAYDSKISGNADAFVVKIDQNGDLVYSTYLGGGGPDKGKDIAIYEGSAFITGETQSSSFPITPNAAFADSHGKVDAFVTKLTPAGSSLAYSTYLGGTGDDIGNAIFVSDGQAYVAGQTGSNNFVTLPIPGTLDDSLDGTTDAFLARFNENGSEVLYATYLGGTGSDSANAIVLDGSDNIYLAGSTDSVDLPDSSELLNGIQPIYGGGISDAFILKLVPSGTSAYTIGYATYFGGNGEDMALGLAGNGSESLWITGSTSSNNLPTSPDDAIQDTFQGGNSDAFIINVDATGAGPADLKYSTYFGGNGEDRATGIAAAGSNVYIVGQTDSTGGFATAGAFDTDLGGPTDAFAAGLRFNQAPVAVDDEVTTDEDTAVIFDVVTNDSDPNGDDLVIAIDAEPNYGTVVINTDNTLTYTPDPNFNGTDVFLYSVNDGIDDSNSATVSITINAVNDPPVLVQEIGAVYGLLDESSTELDLTDYVSDVDIATNGDSLALAIIAPLPGEFYNCQISTSIEGLLLTINFADEQQCSDTITLRASDAVGATLQTTFDLCLDNREDSLDTDGDLIGDFCDPDDDNDGVVDGVDSCPANYNPKVTWIDINGDAHLCELGDEPGCSQPDFDLDGFGDACDSDADGDGCVSFLFYDPAVHSCWDCFDTDPNQQGGDCIGAAEKPSKKGGVPDSDGDGTSDTLDSCPNDAAQPDTDSDGVCDDVDSCPALSNADQADSDKDGVGDACDICPNNYDPAQSDNDGDGLGDVCDPDDDGDGILDDGNVSGIEGDSTCTAGAISNCDDNCRFVSNSNQADTDGDGRGNTCDAVDNAIAVTLTDASDPASNYHNWLPQIGNAVTITATENPFQPGATGISVSVVSVTNIAGKYTNDADSGTQPDFDYGISGNSITLTPQDYGGFITIQVMANGGTVVEQFVFPEDQDADNLADAWELIAFGNLYFSGDGDYDGDGLTNAQEARGFKWGPELALWSSIGTNTVGTANYGALYQTEALVPQGEAGWFSTDPTRKDLFLRVTGYDFNFGNADNGFNAACDCPFGLGTAYDGVGVDVHAVSIDNPPDYTTTDVAAGDACYDTVDTGCWENNIDVVKVTNNLTNTFATSDGHINKRGNRDWDWDTKGFSGIGTATVYGLGTTTYQVPLDNYFTDQPYLDDSAYGVLGELDPVASADVEDKNDNAALDKKEDTVSNNDVLDGDYLVVPISYAYDLTVHDIDNDSYVELPLVADPGLPQSPGFVDEYTLAQVLKHTITHEVGHALGMNHNANGICLMYQYSNNWRRDDTLSVDALDEMNIHNN